MALLHFSWKGNVFVVYLHWHLQYISIGTYSISYFSVVVYLLKNKDSTKSGKNHFSRRFSVSLTTFVDTFIESSLKVFILPSFPSWYCLHLRKDGQAGVFAFYAYQSSWNLTNKSLRSQNGAKWAVVSNLGANTISPFTYSLITDCPTNIYIPILGVKKWCQREF